MKNLLLSSFLIILLLCSCSLAHHHRYQKTEHVGVPWKINPIIQNDTSALLYKAGIHFYGKYFSGLFLFKKMDDTTQRVVFYSETGIGFFDFEFSGEHFAVKQCMDKFNNKGLINTFRNDLGMIILANQNAAKADLVANKKDKDKHIVFRYKQGKEIIYYYITDKGTRYSKIERASKCFIKTVIMLENTENDLTTLISIRHKNINLKIDLKLIPRF